MVDFKAPLSQGWGYGFIIGLGALFAVGMIATTSVLRRYQKEIITAEEFSTAGRSVRPGLCAAAVVSSWIWCSTLLTSTSKAYDTGVLGSYAYASAACFQIIAFSILAIKTKQKAPNAHTYLEIVKARYGTLAHSCYIFYAVATNILVTAMLLTSGATVFYQLTGMNVVAASFLLPVGVVIYTLFGGIKATFLTDYIHTVVIICILLVFAFTVFATNEDLGSPGKVYDLVREAAKRHPVPNNAEGEYMTMKSRSAGIFMLLNLVGNMGTVFLDNGYWNKAISANPAGALKGYAMGGVCWFSIPSLISLTMGFACLAMELSPKFPTYPDLLTSYQVSEGLVLPAAAISILGGGGAVATILMVFLAVTSAMSAELIAVSSVFTYDIYKQYINPRATGKQLIYSSHAMCIIFGFGMSGFSVGLYYGGVSMGFIYEMMGIIISSAVLPVVLTLCWSKMNLVAAIASPILGSGLAIMAWLVCAKSLYGELTIVTTFEDYPMLAGNLVALCSPAFFIPIFTYAFKPQNFDWEILKTIKRADETPEIENAEHILTVTQEAGTGSSSASMDNDKNKIKYDDKERLDTTNSILSAVDKVTDNQLLEELEAEEKYLKKAVKIAYFLCAFFALAFLVVWPMPMYGSGYIFSKRFFTGWVVVMIIWVFICAMCVCIYPLYEGRKEIRNCLRGLYWDLTGKSYKLREWQNEHPEEMHVVQSQLSARLHSNTSRLGRVDNQLDDIIT